MSDPLTDWEARLGAEKPHDGLPPSTLHDGFRWRRGFNAERCDCCLSNLPRRSQRSLECFNFGLQRGGRCGALPRLALGLR